MSRIKSYLLGFITLCITITAFGQNQITIPNECANLPAGHTTGADFRITPSIAGCLTDSKRSALVSINDVVSPNGLPFINQGGTVQFNYNYKDSDGSITFPANSTTPNFTYTAPGTYWVVMNGVIGTTSYIKCKSVEIIDTKKLEIDYDFCDDKHVTIIIKDTPSNREQPRILIDWADGNTKTYDITTFPHTIDYTYTTAPLTRPKVQGIYVRGNRDACTSDGLNLDTTPSDAPKIVSLVGLAGGTQNVITVKGGTPDVEFTIEMKPKGGAWTSTGKTIKLSNTANATATETITVPNGSGEYCFRLLKNGLCGLSTTSDPVCTIKSSSQVLSPQEVKVDWTSESYVNPPTTSSIIRYRIFYKEIPTNANQNSVSVAPSASPSFIFDQMDCSKKYEFWIEGGWGVGANSVLIKSPPFEVNPAQGGTLPNGLVSFASVNQKEVRITMYTNGAIYDKYNIYKAEGNSNDFKPLISVNNNYYTDQAVELDKQQYCYKVSYEDACGNKSELSDAFCTIFLTSAQPNTLNWTPFIISDPTSLRYDVKPVEYIVQILDENYTVLSTPGNTFDTEFDVKFFLDALLNDPLNNGKVIFRVLAKQGATMDWEGVAIDFPLNGHSNTYTFITPAILYVPSAFTPDGTGPPESEVFKANGKFISEFNMIIYNRWGAPIFESKDMEIGWDGKENGVPAPQGNYSYKIFGHDHAGQEFNKVGSVLLLK